ncbi:hypothetical protein C8R43DRAFT_20863 [Mycena crocata]|nr:hypothetical protein C8R43DRAFT_20863 [Mycena crocata]
MNTPITRCRRPIPTCLPPAHQTHRVRRCHRRRFHRTSPSSSARLKPSSTPSSAPAPHHHQFRAEEMGDAPFRLCYVRPAASADVRYQRWSGLGFGPIYKRWTVSALPVQTVTQEERRLVHQHEDAIITYHGKATTIQSTRWTTGATSHILFFRAFAARDGFKHLFILSSTPVSSSLLNSRLTQSSAVYKLLAHFVLGVPFLVSWPARNTSQFVSVPVSSTSSTA